MTYAAALKDVAALTTSGFSVEIDGQTYTPESVVSGASGSEDELTITLSDDITAITDKHVLIVRYTGSDLKDPSDNPFSAFTQVINVAGATGASYFADGIADTEVNGAGTQITLTFDEVIDNPTFTVGDFKVKINGIEYGCLLYTSPSPRDLSTSRMPSSA